MVQIIEILPHEGQRLGHVIVNTMVADGLVVTQEIQGISNHGIDLVHSLVPASEELTSCGPFY